MKDEELAHIARGLMPQSEFSELSEIKIFKVLEADVDGDGQVEICFVAGNPVILEGITILLDPEGNDYKTIEIIRSYGFRDLQILDINQDHILEIVTWWQQGSYLFLDIQINQWNGVELKSLFPSMGRGGCPFGAFEVKDLDADNFDEIVVWSGGWSGPAGIPRPFDIHTFKYNGQEFQHQATYQTDFAYYPTRITNMRQGGNFNQHLDARHRVNSVEEYRKELEDRIHNHELTHEFLSDLFDHQSVIQGEGFFEESIQIGDLVLRGTENLSSPEALKLRLYALGAKGFTLGLLGDYSNAIECYQQIVPLWSCGLPNDILPSDHSAAYREMGTMYSALGDYEHTLESLSIANEIAKKLNLSLPENQRELFYVYYDFGVAYNRLGNPTQAIPAFEQGIQVCRQAIQLFQKNYLIPELAISYIGLGNAQRLICAYQDAIQSYKTALEELKTSPIRNLEAEIYLELGLALLLAQQFEEGLAYLKRSLLFASTGNIRQMEGRHYLYIGEAYRRLENFQLAKQFYRKNNSIGSRIWNS